MERGFDYYLNTPCFLKMILDILPEPEVSQEARLLARDAYNKILNNSSVREIVEISTVSQALWNKIQCSSASELVRFASLAYENYIVGLLRDSAYLGPIFDGLKDSVKLFASDFVREYVLTEEQSEVTSAK